MSSCIRDSGRERRDLFGVPRRCSRRPVFTGRCTVCGFLRASNAAAAVLFGGNLPLSQRPACPIATCRGVQLPSHSIARGNNVLAIRWTLFVEKVYTTRYRFYVHHVYISCYIGTVPRRVQSHFLILERRETHYSPRVISSFKLRQEIDR